MNIGKVLAMRQRQFSIRYWPLMSAYRALFSQGRGEQNKEKQYLWPVVEKYQCTLTTIKINKEVTMKQVTFGILMSLVTIFVSACNQNNGDASTDASAKIAAPYTEKIPMPTKGKTKFYFEVKPAAK